jgi:DNA-directed RNA polymerase omega subunit
MSMTIEPVKLDVEKNGEVQVDSIYRLIILAGLRSKQLLRGSTPRIKADPLRRKNTSIALEELRQGLVSFTVNGKGAVAEEGITS